MNQKQAPKPTKAASSKSAALEELKRSVSDRILAAHAEMMYEPMYSVTSAGHYDSLSPTLGFVYAREYEGLQRKMENGPDKTWSVVTGGSPQGNLRGKSLQYYSLITPQYDSLLPKQVVRAEPIVVEERIPATQKKAAVPTVISLSTIEQFVNVCLNAKYIAYVYVDIKDIGNLQKAISILADRFPYFALMYDPGRIQKLYEYARTRKGSNFIILKVVPPDLVYPKGVLDLYKFNCTYFDIWGISPGANFVFKSLCRFMAADSFAGALVDEQGIVMFESSGQTLRVYANAAEKEKLQDILAFAQCCVSLYGKDKINNVLSELFSTLSGI